MTWFAIRRVHDGAYLPAPPINHRGGQSHVDIMPPELGIRPPPPRLFPSKAGAESCLKQWRKGHWSGKETLYITDPKDPLGKALGMRCGKQVTRVKYRDPRVNHEYEVVEVDVVPVQTGYVSVFDNEAD